MTILDVFVRDSDVIMSNEHWLIFEMALFFKQLLITFFDSLVT